MWLHLYLYAIVIIVFSYEDATGPRKVRTHPSVSSSISAARYSLPSDNVTYSFGFAVFAFFFKLFLLLLPMYWNRSHHVHVIKREVVHMYIWIKKNPPKKTNLNRYVIINRDKCPDRFSGGFFSYHSVFGLCRPHDFPRLIFFLRLPVWHMDIQYTLTFFFSFSCASGV